MNEEMNKALIYFGRKDLTDGLYENDIDDNVQVFLAIRQMIKLYNLQSKIDKAIEFIDGRIQILTVSVDNKAKDEYFNNKCIGGIQELKNVKEFLKEDK